GEESFCGDEICGTQPLSEPVSTGVSSLRAWLVLRSRRQRHTDGMRFRWTRCFQSSKMMGITSIAEAAGALGITVGTAKTRAHRPVCQCHFGAGHPPSQVRRARAECALVL